MKVTLFTLVVVLKPFGPLQLYELIDPVPVTLPAVNVSEVPTHNSFEDAVMPATVGNAFTVTAGLVTAVVLVQPLPVYVTLTL